MLPKLEGCRGCVGHGWDDGCGFTLNEGDGQVRLLVVSEAPGEWEAEEGLPLRPNGASGKVFRRALRELGIRPSTITISNILRCRPPGNELRGASYEREAIDHCRQYLDRTIREAKPTVILALGDVPLRELAAERLGSVTAMRGFLLPSVYNIPMVATYHPSYIARGAWQLFGAFKHDIAFAYRCAVNGPPTPMETHYVLRPSIDDAQWFLSSLVTDRSCPVSYDIETASILGEPEPADWRQKRIIQIQFSAQAGHAVVLPLDTREQWNGFAPHARSLLALPNPKWGWNSRLSDDLVLESNGFAINGERHDLMNAWGHLNPSFWGKDKEIDTDKGVPSRLMGLQSCTSFYIPEQSPWKHLSADPANIPYYGAIDADMTLRCGQGIMDSLTAQGLMDGYRSHKLDLRPVLDYLGEIGLPVDRTKQAELRTYVTGELQRIQTAIQGLIPPDLTGTHPKTGYKTFSAKMQVGGSTGPQKSLRELAEAYDPANPPLVMAAKHTGYLVERQFLRNAVGEELDYGPKLMRWCIQRLYNPHGSSPNTKQFIRHMGYRMPVKIDDPTVETTGKSELKKLADETGDKVLKLTYEWRELAKTGLDYTGGAWVPGEDDRVHATFKFGTASDQLVATAPAVMTYPEHSEIAKMAKGAIVAQPGHTLCKIDMRGFHARSIGWLANDPVYYRLADFDVHSYVTAHFLHLHDAPYLDDMADDELHAALGTIKHDHTHTRNYKVKRVCHGRQFGLQVRKLYLMNSDNFDPKPEQVIEEVGESKWYDWDRKRQLDEIARRGRREATTLFQLFDQKFPRVFVVFPAWVDNQIRNVTKNRLVSPFGSHRLFWDYDLQQATAYLPSNIAHRHFQAALVRLYRSGALQHFECINITHDAGWFHPRTELVEECIATVQHEFELPSTVLVDSPLGPFQCNSDAEYGTNLNSMTAWKG